MLFFYLNVSCEVVVIFIQVYAAVRRADHTNITSRWFCRIGNIHYGSSGIHAEVYRCNCIGCIARAVLCGHIEAEITFIVLSRNRKLDGSGKIIGITVTIFYNRNGISRIFFTDNRLFPGREGFANLLTVFCQHQIDLSEICETLCHGCFQSNSLVTVVNILIEFILIGIQNHTVRYHRCQIIHNEGFGGSFRKSISCKIFCNNRN